MRHGVALVSVLSCAILLLAACGGRGADPTAPHSGPPKGPPLKGDFSGAGPGTLVSAEGLVDLDPALRDKTSLAARIVYESTSGINDSHSLVTATVFVPKGDPPPGGWNVVALGHPSTGIQPQCAPSASPTLLGSASAVGALIDDGYLVAATDYQGLGLSETDHSTSDSTIGPYNDYHPFLDSTTEGYNVIDSVRAARKLVPAASDTFAVWGTGQGGQAAWAANELAPDYRGVLNLAGVVAEAPTSALDWLADAAADGTLTRDQQLTLVQFLAALKSEDSAFDLDAYRHGAVKDNWNALTACWGPASHDRDRLAEQIGPDDLRPDGPDATEALRAYLRKTSLPQAPTAAPMLVVPDGPDGLIPEAQTDAAVARACAMGDVIQLGDPKGSDPSAWIDWINDRFNAVPAQNDCAGLTATEPPNP
jgi:Secretory lipase